MLAVVALAVISLDLAHPLNVFDPAETLGAGIDGHEKGATAQIFTPANIAAMRSAGLKPLSYRLRTELAGDVWHWNPRGAWSDAAHNQGYWISDSTPGSPIEVSYGYRLPRRGNTTDQALNDGYSRISDGDRDTFWKSNPYLAPEPQWVAIDLGRKTPVDTLRIVWGTPWALDYRVQYATSDEAEIANPGIWRDFPSPAHRAAQGGEVTARIASAPVNVRRVRILLNNSSNTAPPGANDPRDRQGFAIREISLGVTTAGHFRDVMRHAPNHDRQTVVWVSSTDPWHRATDRDDGVEQPGLDRVFQSGLTSGRPMLTPTGILYDTPENAIAEIRYLKARGYAVNEVELGEEPEEQQVPPEFYGALYLRWAAALHALDPALKIGGPSLVLLAPEAQETPSWTARWIAYLRAHNALANLQFFSFEWYPFDEVCEPVAPQLARAATLLTRSLQQMAKDGVPSTIPWYITEYGYSAFGTQAEVELPGAILNSDIAGTFLAFGGVKAFLYGYEPGDLLHERPCTWGNNMLFQSAEPLRKMPTYYAARLLTEEWAQPPGGRHTLYAAKSTDPRLSVYAVRRPDGLLSLLLLNKNPTAAIDVQLPFRGKTDVFQYSPAQYRWQAAGENGHPVRNLPPVHTSGEARQLRLPPYSITVVRGGAPF